MGCSQSKKACCQDKSTKVVDYSQVESSDAKKIVVEPENLEQPKKKQSVVISPIERQESGQKKENKEEKETKNDEVKVEENKVSETSEVVVKDKKEESATLVEEAKE